MTGDTKHLVQGAQSTDVSGQIAWVEIEDAEVGGFLFRFDASGLCLADTWHDTVESAMAQASYEYDVEDSSVVRADS